MPFERNPDSEFDFLLADRLGIGTVEELRDRMSSWEFAQWAVFHARRNQEKELQRRKELAKQGITVG